MATTAMRSVNGHDWVRVSRQFWGRKAEFGRHGGLLSERRADELAPLELVRPRERGNDETKDPSGHRTEIEPQRLMT